MDKIKLLYISQSTGGVQRHLISLLEKINRDRFDVTVICPPKDLTKGAFLDKESFLEALQRIGMKSYPVNMGREIRPVSDLLSFLKIYFFIKKERFDIVHTHSSKAGFLGRIAAGIADTPVIIHTPHSFAFDRPPSMLFSKIFYAILEKFAGLFCNKVIAVCEDEKKLAVKLHVLPAKKIEVISNAVDPSLYDMKLDSPKKREELGLRQADKIIIFVGRFAYQKAPLDFISVASKVVKSFSNAVFLMLGDGPLLGMAKKSVYKNRLSDVVKILDWRNDTREIIAISDIFVLSSLWEVLPNYSLLDAMGLRRPIVTTDTFGASDLVRNGYNGFVVPKARPELLAEAILKMLRLSDVELLEFGKHSRETLEKRLDLSKTVKKIEELYESLLWVKK